eukprot:7632960-Alexandrium_andersonii.AAC.1
MNGSEIRGRLTNLGPGCGGSEMNGSEIRGRFRNLAPGRGPNLKSGSIRNRGAAAPRFMTLPNFRLGPARALNSCPALSRALKR